MSIKMTGEQLKIISNLFPNMTVQEFITLINNK